MISVICCGCMRILGKDGETMGDRLGNGGQLDIRQIVAHFANFREGAATFKNESQADAAALTRGWEAKGGDHRCPQCRIDKPKVDRSGAYIDWGEAA